MANMNGHDNDNITSFPTKEERETLEKARIMHPHPPRSEPAINLPPVVQALCLINLAIFLVTEYVQGIDEYIYDMAFVPARYSGGLLLGVAGIVSPITYMFIHAGWMHILVNLGMLMAFGSGLERALGKRPMLLIYFISGLAGALVHGLVEPSLQTPMIGASGAISGLFGAVLMMTQVKSGGFQRLLPFICVWVGISVAFGIFGMPGSDNPIAWTTHLGGFFAGLLLYRPVSRKKMQH